jgi:hypothetical protein
MLVVLLAAASSCVSRAAPPADAAKIDRLIEGAGIAHSTRQILPNMVSGMSAQQEGVPPALRAAMIEAAGQAFQPGPMIETIRSRLGAGLNGKELDDTLAWVDSPVGRRITSVENAASEPAAMSGMEAFLKELEQRPPPQSQLDLVVQLNVMTGAVEMTSSMIEGIALATALGINASLPVEQQAPFDVLRKQLAAAMPDTRLQAAQMVTVYALYAYRTLSEKELAAYVDFMKSPSGTAYAKAALAAFNAAMLDALTRFMHALPKALEKHKGAVGT